MTSLAEVFDYTKSSVVPTYSESEGGYAVSDQSITVHVNLNDAGERKLHLRFKENRGYQIEVNRRQNLVSIRKRGNLCPDTIMSYIRRSVDPNAREVGQ